MVPFAKLRLLLVLLVAGCDGTQQNPDLQIVLGERVGAITSETTRTELDQLFGQANVADIQYPYYEGETIPGTVIFPGTDKEGIILWRQHDRSKTAERVVIVGHAWNLPEGLRKGDNIAATEKLNGAPFMIYGFEWDYAGLGYFKGGALDRLAAVKFRPNVSTTETYSAVVGDQLFNSKDPAVIAVDPRVDEVSIILPGPARD
jgi:hypothetical protein